MTCEGRTGLIRIMLSEESGRGGHHHMSAHWPSGSAEHRGSGVKRSLLYQASSLQDYDYPGHSTGTRTWGDNLQNDGGGREEY